MAKVREEKPKSLPEFLEIVEKYRRTSGGPLWYRGCGNNSYTLNPSLYRHTKAKTPEDLAELERQIMGRFRQRSIPYQTRRFEDDWDQLFFMQHYGVPTRLLDWTENPFVALHFALMGARQTFDGAGVMKYNSPAAIWILDPVKWNQHALSHIRYDGGVLAPGDEALNGYRPAPAFAGMNSRPVALYGAYNSPRIVAQQGAFVIFGQNTEPMELAYDTSTFPTDCLVRLVVAPTSIKAFRKSLLNHGITESVVFPDLEGLAREMQRVFGFCD